MTSNISINRILLLSAVALATSVPVAGAENHLHGQTNHLQGQVSPYLVAHAHDRVDWYPWGDAAFARAKKENKPIFLTSGFSACHWCHVMQKESFSDAVTAKFLNDNFVCVIVDREEHPDVDEVYTRAAQAVGGRAGWPLTVFLTADKKPFFAGTYFPREAKFGLPPFSQVLRGVLQSWREKRSSVNLSAAELYHSVSDLNSVVVDKNQSDTIKKAGEKLMQNVDPDWGGLAGDRKFAHFGILAFALQQLKAMPRTAWSKDALAQGYLQYLTVTLDNMAAGGIHDQLRGGFFRYATDRQWRVPHFEKMLSDNALMAQTYLQAGELLGRDKWKNIALETIDFCMTEMMSPDGAFYGSVDADSGGSEGGYYTFSQAEVIAALGADDGRFFCTTYGVKAKGKNNLFLPGGPDRDRAQHNEKGEKEKNEKEKLGRLKGKLLASEMMQKRARPLVDKKIIAAWNGLMVSSLVDAYKKSGRKKYLDAAIRCQSFIIKNLYENKSGRLQRVWAGGRAQMNGCLDDYAFQIRALLDLSEVDKNPEYAARAVALNDYVLSHFVGPRVGFYYSAVGSDPALVRTSCAQDNGLPAPAAIQVSNLLRLYGVTGNRAFLSVAQSTTRIYRHDAAVEPSAYGFMLCAIDQVEKDANAVTH